MNTEEKAHILQPLTRFITNGHLHLFIVGEDKPFGIRFHLHVQELTVDEQLLETHGKILLAELHIGEQTVVIFLIATTEEMVVNLVFTLFLTVRVGIIFGFHQIGTEHAVTFHHGAIELQEIEPF